MPSWSEPVSLTCSAIAIVALLVAIVLLALPASNQFFRKPPTGGEPPLPGAAYPGGQPPSAGDPGYPSSYQGPSPSSGGAPGYPPNNPPPGTPGNPPAS